MRLPSARFCTVLLLLCAACEIHAGDSDWDAAGFWDDEDSGFDHKDASQRDGRAADEDAGRRDAAVSGKDAGNGDIPPIDSGLPPIDEPTDVTPDAFAAVLAKGRCGALEKCIGKTLLLESLKGNDCVDYRTHQSLDRDTHWLTKAVALGRVTFRASQLAKCQADIIALGCDVQNRRLPASCEDAVEGKADVDQACSIDQECTDNLFCDKGTLETCPGQCAGLQTTGLPCSNSGQCTDGLICRGGSCGLSLDEGDACTSYLGSECPPGLVCQGQGSADELTCQSIASVYAGKDGEACDAFGKLCQSGLVCKSQSASNTKGICGPPVAAGGTCRRAVPNQCPNNQYCKDTRAGVSSRAAPGKDGVCADLPADGQGCDAAIGCKAGAICLVSDSMCHAYRSVGDDCVEDAECYSASCSDGKCAAPLECLM